MISIITVPTLGKACFRELCLLVLLLLANIVMNNRQYAILKAMPMPSAQIIPKVP